MRFEALQETLLKAGIAPRHVRRYLRELDDHLADLTTAQQEAGHDEESARLRARALLGGDDELSAAMLAQRGFRSLPARAPWLVFGLLPPVLITAAFVAMVLPLVAIVRLNDLDGHMTKAAPGWFQMLAHAVAAFANLSLAPGLAALLVWTASRQRLSWKYPLLGVALIALFGVHMAANFPGQHGGSLSVSVMNEFHHNPPESWTEFLIQFFLTLAPALWLLRDRWFARPAELG